MCCYHPALHLLSQINPTTTSTARPLTLRTSLKVTWPCRCGGVPGQANPQLVTLISGEAPWWAAELLYQRRKEEGERMEGWRKASGGKKAGVAGQWSIPEDLWTKHTPSFSHTHKHKHTLCILKEKQSQCGAEGSFVDAQQTASEWWCGIDLMLTYMSVSADFVAVFPSYSFNLSLRRLCKTGCYQSKRIKSSLKNHQDHTV